MKKIRNYTIEDAEAGKLPLPFNGDKAIEVKAFEKETSYPIIVLFHNNHYKSFNSKGFYNKISRLEIEEEITKDDYLEEFCKEYLELSYNINFSLFDLTHFSEWCVKNKKLNIPE